MVLYKVFRHDSNKKMNESKLYMAQQESTLPFLGLFERPYTTPYPWISSHFKRTELNDIVIETSVFTCLP